MKFEYPMEAADHSKAELGLGKFAIARGSLEKATIHFRRAGRSDELASDFNQMAIALLN